MARFLLFAVIIFIPPKMFSVQIPEENNAKFYLGDDGKHYLQVNGHLFIIPYEIHSSECLCTDEYW